MIITFLKKYLSPMFLLSVTMSCSALKVLKIILKREFFRVRIELYTRF